MEATERFKKKMNCWEFMQCGREPGGKKTEELGVCPVTQERRLHNIHEGKHAGRACWVVAGSLCGGETQGTFAQKFKNCESCDFYQHVRHEEGGGFTLSAVLLGILRSSDQMAGAV